MHKKMNQLDICNYQRQQTNESHMTVTKLMCLEMPSNMLSNALLTII